MRREKLKLFFTILLLLSFLFLFKKETQAVCGGCTNTACTGGFYDTPGGCGVGQFKCCPIATQPPAQGGGGPGAGEGSNCCKSSECSPGLRCVGADVTLCGGGDGNGVGLGTCEKSGGGAGSGLGNGTEVNIKCNCTNEFSACEDKFGKEDIQWRKCTRKATGSETCNLRVGVKFYQTKACESGPTATPGGPTPTVNPNCGCTSGSCTSACTFKGVSNASSVKCSLAGDLFQSAPTDTNKTGWCQRPKRTKGDANGDGALTDLDYMYYVSAVNGGKIPAVVNPDFNGDGEVGAADRTIIIGSL